MRELSLFSGAGGGLLATQHLLGWTTIGYVEIADYCQHILAQRIRDGYLGDAPIFGDIQAFLDSGCAELYRGITDIVSAGFPCQPASRNGKGLGVEDPRWRWPQVKETLRSVKPQWFLGENVPGLLSVNAGREYGIILRDLAQLGFSVRWGCLSAASLGYPHIRKRVWIVATDTAQPGWEKLLCDDSPDGAEARHALTLDAPRHLIEGLEQRLGESAICGVDDGLAHRVDRLEAIGNGQVPAVAAAAWHRLTGA